MASRWAQEKQLRKAELSLENISLAQTHHTFHIQRCEHLAMQDEALQIGEILSPTRFYVQESVFERFAAGFAERASKLRVGDGLHPDTQMGPLAHPRRIQAMEHLIEDAQRCGAQTLAGGACMQGPGLFFQPTVLKNVPETARVMNEEPFGPLALLNPFTSVDEVLAKANRLPFGLAAYAFTRDLGRAQALSAGIDAGMVGVNTFAISLVEAPFGGLKESGHGSDNAVEGLETHLVTKFVNQS